MAKNRQQLDRELDALAAAVPYLKHRAASQDEFRARLDAFVEEIKLEASGDDIDYVETRAAEIAEQPRTAYQTPHS